MRKLYALLFAVLATPLFALTRYVDATAPGPTHDGTSWNNAWRNITSIAGVGGGDTVFVSGGTTTKTYNLPTFWNVPDGNTSAQLTIRIGEDPGHDGVAILNCTGSDGIFDVNYVTFDFWHNGTRHLRFTGNPSTGNNVSDDQDLANSSKRFRIYGAEFNWRLYLYKSRETEIAWCKFAGNGEKLYGGPGWVVGVGDGDTSGYGMGSSIHDNEVHLLYLRIPDADRDNGDDFAQNFSNLDVYNNTIISTETTVWAGDNHQDFFQSEPNYMRFWNNYFENASNYVIFGELWEQRGTRNWQIWNNVFNYSDPVLTSNPTQAIAIGNGKGNPAINIDFYDMFIFNNTFRGAQQSIVIGTAGMTNTFHNVRVQNNLRLTDGGGIISMNGTLADGSIVSNNPSVASNYFVNVAGKNFHLTSNATGAIGQGTTSGGFFPTISTTDKDGVARGVTWDIGAYEFVSATGPGGLSFSTVPYTVAEGAGSLLVTINRFNGTTGTVGVSYATSNGSATAGSDYTSTSGTLSFADGVTSQSFSIPITQDASTEGNESLNITLSAPTGGASIIGVSSTTATIVDDDAAPTVPLMSGLTFAANLGLIEAPFSAAGAIVSQTVDTGNTDGGRARYRVTIPTTGDYSMTMIMDCASTGTDSIYVSWDGEPLEPADVFDVGVTAGAQTKVVTHRGTGTPATPQFNPWFKNLTAGVHELTIRGREPNAKFSSITVVAAPLADTTAPTPNPPTWEQFPGAPPGPPGQSRLSMRASVVTDPSGPVQYNFRETSGNPGGSDSGWQLLVDYTDEGLSANTLYIYRIEARDSQGNVTSLSTAESATTNAIVSGSTTINATNLILDP